MVLTSAASLVPGQHIEADVCIAGSGPAGLVVADRLARDGLSVCVLESGGDGPSEAAQALNAIVSAGQPLRANFVNRQRALGGTSTLWAGRCMALEPCDFAPIPALGRPGWPISYQTFAAWLERAAAVMQLPDRQASGPSPVCGLAAKPAYWARRPPDFWKRLGPALRRARAVRVVTGLTITRLIFDAAGSRVTALSAMPTVGADAAGAGVRVSARCYVLALGGIETTRMLLLAARACPGAVWAGDALGRYYMDHPRAVFGGIRLERSVDFSACLGRPLASGMVQTGLGLSTDQRADPALLNASLYLEPAVSDAAAEGYDASARVMQRILRRGHAGGRLDFSGLSHGALRDRIYQLTPREVLPHGLYRRYFALRRRIRPHPRSLVIVSACEQLPDPESRITLATETDRFGNPLPRLDWRIGAWDIESVRALHCALGRRLAAAGAGALTHDPEALDRGHFVDASHHMGGTRMSGDAAEGTVDGDLAVHGTDNLYLCSTSVFPSGGSANPTWSLVALALRLGAHLSAGLAR